MKCSFAAYGPSNSCMSICLTQREILELTRETLPSAQIRVLETLGIPFVARSNGFVGVLRATIEQRNGRLRRLWRQY
jgi:hypothetical protein